MNKKIIISIIIIVMLVLFNFLNKENDPKIKTPNGSYTALIANTDTLRTKGLSGKPNLDEKEVMLFTFEKPGNHGIWMKEMLFNIDIVFLDEEMKVINYYDDVSPLTYPTIFYPERNALYVIEMASGERLKSGLDKDTKVYYK